ncbi:MAG TPA: IS1 family transposase [Polyangia bacterium]|nr:IS1 family transposase [Polyangia bacterium]
MNRLSLERRVQILGILVEGGSLRSASRLADVSINTVTKLLVDVGQACEAYQIEKLVNLPCKRIQCDEIWSFVGAKQKNVPSDKQGQWGIGDTWTWVGLDADNKFVVSWLVADRSAEAARRFVTDIAGRLTSRVQVTSDGLKLYLDAVEQAFGSEVDFAQIVKHYGNEGKPENQRYSPAVCTGAEKIARVGNPDMAHVSTSYIERQNLTMGMSMRRFTRLTNGFSKKIENHMHAIALYFMHYNFVRIHKTLRVTPAMAAGVSDRVWSLAEIAELAN